MRIGTRPPRLYARLSFLAAAVLLLWVNPKLLVQSSLFVAICSPIASRGISVRIGIGLAFALIAILRSRWFCRYACPMGLLLEAVSRIGLNRTAWWAHLPQLGRYAALATMAGAVVGYPVLLWMDPLSIFSGIFAVRIAADLLSGILAGALILLSLISGAVWCSRLCPLGGTQDLISSIRLHFQNRGEASPNQHGIAARRAFIVLAAGAGIGFWAQRVRGAQSKDEFLRPPGAVVEKDFAGICVRCGNCVRACPSRIIYPDVGSAGLTGLLAPVIHYEKNYCREDCAACTKACPTGALHPLGVNQKREYVIGEALLDTSLCLLALQEKDCDACKRACPFEAVQIHWDEEQYVAYPVIDFHKCNGCGACEVACPAKGTKAIRVWRITNDGLRITN
jgi:MauM/NapG family ferredoxin protein